MCLVSVRSVMIWVGFVVDLFYLFCFKLLGVELPLPHTYSIEP